MIDLQNLKVSLTKNGYLKTATIIAGHSSQEMLDHCSGTHRGVNLVRSQVANILCADASGMVPGFWDEVRRHDRATIRAFTFVAIVFAHQRLIQIFQGAGEGHPHGTILRSDFATEKEYTNLQFAMAEVGLCEYARGTDQITYEMGQLVQQLRPVGPLVGELLRAKLRRCGWRDPGDYRIAADLPLCEQCVEEEFHKVFGLTGQQFVAWIMGRPRHPR
jgi:hypothetical protein